MIDSAPPAAPVRPISRAPVLPLSRSPARTFACELAALAVLLIGGAAVRLNGLAAIPSWTDETREILIGLDILAGESRPLTGVNAYIGALWSWLLAGAFAVVGPRPELPRVVACVFGLATIPLTYLLARRLEGIAAGWIAAGLLAVSGAHVLVTSRIAWSHSTTPFFVTLALWLLLSAPAGGGPRLVLSGLAGGLALQSHVTAAPLAVAAAVYVLGWRRAWLRGRWLWPALLAFLAACADLILAVLVEGTGPLLDDASNTYGAPAGGQLLAALTGRGGSGAVANVGALLLTFLRLLSGAIDARPSAAAYLRDPIIWLSLGLLLVGLARASRRASPLPLLALSGWGLLILFVLKDNGAIPNGRFLMPIVPLSLALIGVGCVGLAHLVRPRLGRSLVVAALFGVLAGASTIHLFEKIDDLKPSQQSSEALDRLADTALAERGPGEPIFLDPLLEKLWLDGGGTWRSALRYRFRLGGAPIAELRERVGDERFEIDTCATNRAVLHRLTIGSGDPLERLLPATQLPPRGSTAWVVRVAEPREDVSAANPVGRNRPPLAANGRAVRTCDRGRLI